MSDESSTSLPPPIKRKPLVRRIYLSTWLAIVLAAGVMFFLEYPGYRSSYQYWHGWPCVWLVNYGDGKPWSLGSPSERGSIIRSSLVVDIAFALFVVVLVGWLFQKWRTKHGSLLRYRLRTLLALVTASALIIAPIAAWHREYAAEQRVIDELKRECADAGPSIASSQVSLVREGRIGVDIGSVWEPPDWLPDSVATLDGIRQLFDRVQWIEVRSERSFRPTTLSQLSKLPDLRSLKIYDGEVGGDAFRSLCRIGNLQTLIVIATVTDRDIDELPALSKLDELRLWRTRITDAGLKTLAQLTNLRHLSLESDLLTGTGLADLKSLPNLSHLELTARGLTDEGIATIRGFPALKQLRIFAASLRSPHLRCDVPSLDLTCGEGTVCVDFSDAKALESLAVGRVDMANSRKASPAIRLGNIDRLGSLLLRGVALDESNFSAISQAPALGLLSLDYVEPTDRARLDFRRLSDLKQLHDLSLENADLTDADLSSLCLLSNLKSLDLSFCNVTDKRLIQLQKLTSLTTLWLSHTPVSDKAVAALRTATPSLKTVYFDSKDPAAQYLQLQVTLVRGRLAKAIDCTTDSWKLADDDFACLEGLANLETLDLSDTRLTDAGLERLKRLPKLRELMLRGTLVSDAAARTLTEMPALVHVDIEGTRITAEGRRTLGKLARGRSAERN
jgi:Leucine-rich repeat (LRR) protein